MGDCIMYLLATCCVDLNLLNEAEEYLLKQAKVDYALYKKNLKKDTANAVNANTDTTTNASAITPNTLEEWLGQLEPDECPVPNGAAGFHLLGTVYKRTMRNQKAAGYFQLSLKLDPMLWMSYDALCEMGVAFSLDSKDGIDPAAVFGVIPQGLTHIPSSQGGYGTVESMVMAMSMAESKGEDNEDFMRRAREAKSPFSLSNSPIVAESDDGDVTMHHQDVSLNLKGRLSFGVGVGLGVGGSGTPLKGSGSATPYGHGHGHRHDRGHGHDGDSTDNSAFQGTSLFQGNMSTIRKPGGNGGRRSSVGLPSAALFGTPNFTPRNYEEEQVVLARARQVAGRRYYEPSPETTPPNRIMTTTVPHSSLKLTRRKTRRRFVGPEYDEKYDTVGASGGRGGGADREKRFLFDSSMDATSPIKEEKERTVKTGKKAVASTKKLARVKEEEKEDISAGTPSSNSGEDGGVQYVLELLCTFGAAQRLLCSFKCKEAIQILHTLPHSQFQTGWVQHQVGRAYFASVDYANAQRALETMQELEPHRMKGLELLSTTLYLLKKEVELSNLAQRAVEFDRMAPETWCVVGNCFSLQKEHKTALAFFRRSIQLDPTFTYAHTLSGHEYVANEDFDHAVASFRNAIRVDERHYNAWNGLGEIYFRQEKYDLAEYHFQKGLSINPQSSVIRCNLGQAQHASGKHHLALETLAQVDQRNPQAQYQRANILISMDRLSEALKELEKVRDAAPREASVHFAMGRVLKKMEQPEKAMRCFLTALDLDPKENTLIKSAIDRLDEPDVDEDVSAF